MSVKIGSAGLKKIRGKFLLNYSLGPQDDKFGQAPPPSINKCKYYWILMVTKFVQIMKTEFVYQSDENRSKLFETVWKRVLGVRISAQFMNSSISIRTFANKLGVNSCNYATWKVRLRDFRFYLLMLWYKIRFYPYLDWEGILCTKFLRLLDRFVFFKYNF